MNAPIVSVVMPSLNVGAYIRECLESVMAQSLSAIEIICVDAGSTDGTLDVIKELAQKDSRIRLIRSDKRSYGRQVNLGIDAARGKYLGIVETDDAILPNMYKRLSDVATENVADVVCADYFRFKGDILSGERVYVACAQEPDMYGKVINPIEDPRSFFFTINCGNIYSLKFIRQQKIRLNESPGASYQDIGFFNQVHCLAKRLVFLQEPFYLYRQDNPSSSINSKSKVYACCGEYEFMRKQLERHPKIYEKTKTLLGRSMFFGYWSTLNRIAPEFRMEFAERFSADMRKAFSRGELDRNSFSCGNWKRLLDVMLMPRAFVDATFGSESVLAEPLLVVSLTTWPKRIASVHKVVENMFHQTRRPDKVILYLAEDEFPRHELPASLNAILKTDARFEVRYVANLKSHKKYFYVLKDFPAANVVLVDDDIVYPNSMIRDLLIWHRRMPHAVVCLRSHVMAMSSDGSFAPYENWMRQKKIVGKASPLVFATTGGGTLIPPGGLPESAFDVQKLQELAPTADDLWVKWHMLLAGTPAVFINAYGKDRLEIIPDTQSESLYEVNVQNGGNDRIWKDLTAAYAEEAKELSGLLSAYARMCRLLPAESEAADRECKEWQRLRNEHGFRYAFFSRLEKQLISRSMRFHRRCQSCAVHKPSLLSRVAVRLFRLVKNAYLYQRRYGFQYVVWHSQEKIAGKASEIVRRLKGKKCNCAVTTGNRTAIVPQDAVKVTVIIPVYNAEKYLRQCLDSVLGQTIDGLEVICVDDGSTDHSLSILRNYTERDRRLVLMTQRNLNASIARNRALDAARGEFVAFMDADDLYSSPNVLSRLYEIAKRENVKAVGGQFERFDPKTPNKIERPKSFSFLNPGRNAFADRPFDFFYTLFIFNRQMLLTNAIRFPNVSRYQDPPFMVKAMNVADVFYLADFPVYRYRFGHQNIDWKKNDYRKARDMMRAMTEVVKYAVEKRLPRLVDMTKRRVQSDYADVLFSTIENVESFPEYQGLLAAFPAADAKDIASQAASIKDAHQSHETTEQNSFRKIRIVVK